MCNSNLAEFFIESCETLNLPFSPECLAILAFHASNKATVKGKMVMASGLIFRPEVEFSVYSPDLTKDVIMIYCTKRNGYDTVIFRFERNFDHNFLTIY